jgi:elongation factor P
MEISDVHRNTKLLIDGVPYNVDEAEFVKPGKGRAIYRLKLKNLRTGNTVDRTYHSGEKVEEAHTTTEEEQYLYREGHQYVFMNNETFEQRYIPEELLSNKKGFLKEGMVVTMLLMNNEPIDIALPTFVELKVVQTEIATKTATITPQMKAATLETGLSIGVPSFIKEGDILKIDTRTGNYVERVTKK